MPNKNLTRRLLTAALAALLLAGLAGLSGCALLGKKEISSLSDHSYGGKSYRATGNAGAVCRTASAQKGTYYKYGGATPQTGFDCSGLLYWSFRQNGVNVPRTAKQQSTAGRRVDRSALVPGDILVFKIKSGYHTALYLGDNRFVHSPRTGAKVREENLAQAYWKNAYVGARRII
ncbi:MAG: C40 family peptidase [Deltaproteobacteria bacterium]|jgi:cell wall-associated NlpC family hydrolase|nr:C40 family peptidase [Deltaproteobacteria bacterium]